MPPTRSHIRLTVETYLVRHPQERDALAELLAVLDGPADPCDRTTFPGHVTCSAVVIDRDRRVLHIVRGVSGPALVPGGHVEEADGTLLAAAVREASEKTGIRAGDLCLTPRLLDMPIDIGIQGVDADPGRGEPAHRHYDVRFALHPATDRHPVIVLPDEEAARGEWRPFTAVTSPALRAKLLQAGIDGRPEPVNASVVLYDGAGRYLLHLRDMVPGISAPGEFALLGGGREAGDSCLEATLRRELAEEVPGLEPLDLVPYEVAEATSIEGLHVPVQVYSGRWSGHPETVDLREGVLLHWFTPDILDRLRLSRDTRDLIRRHAADHPPSVTARESGRVPRDGRERRSSRGTSGHGEEAERAIGARDGHRADGTTARPASPDTAATPPVLPGDSVVDPTAARMAMVARLEESGALVPGPVRDALTALPRELLMPQAYVRRSAAGETPPRWDLLDWAAPRARPELLDVLYGGGSVLVQHDGERLLEREPGGRSGSSITSMSTVMSVTAVLLQELDLRPGQSVLDVGTGAGVTASVICQVCGDDGVVTLDRDRHLTEGAAVGLAGLGFRPTAVSGSGEYGYQARAPYDRIFVSYTTERVPSALVAQLACGGKLLVHVTTSSPSWPGLAVVERAAGGGVRAELRAVEFAHRAGLGMERIFLTEEFKHRIATEPGTRSRRGTPAPPSDSDRGLWLAADHLLRGLVRDFTSEQLAIGAPGCGSWLRATPMGRRGWSVTTQGPRDIWKEIQDLSARWRAAGSPDRYRLSFTADGGQHVASECGRLSWRLPTPHPSSPDPAS